MPLDSTEQQALFAQSPLPNLKPALAFGPDQRKSMKIAKASARNSAPAGRFGVRLGLASVLAYRVPAQARRQKESSFSSRATCAWRVWQASKNYNTGF